MGGACSANTGLPCLPPMKSCQEQARARARLAHVAQLEVEDGERLGQVLDSAPGVGCAAQHAGHHAPALQHRVHVCRLPAGHACMSLFPA